MDIGLKRDTDGFTIRKPQEKKFVHLSLYFLTAPGYLPYSFVPIKDNYLFNCLIQLDTKCQSKKE